MNHTTVIKILVLFLIGSNTAKGQEIPKDTIYLKFKSNDGTFPDYRCKKIDKKNDINFNLCKGDGLIFPKKGISDTIAIKELNNYRITKIEAIDSLAEAWKKRTKPLLIKKYGIPYPNTTNKNNMFVTYLIERLKKHFVLYRVYWRSQDI